MSDEENKESEENSEVEQSTPAGENVAPEISGTEATPEVGETSGSESVPNTVSEGTDSVAED